MERRFEVESGVYLVSRLYIVYIYFKMKKKIKKKKEKEKEKMINRSISMIHGQ